jgi:hypothetical protein
MRRTPFEGIRYPWMSDVANAADVQAMAADIDQGLVQTAGLAADWAAPAFCAGAGAGAGVAWRCVTFPLCLPKEPPPPMRLALALQLQYELTY